MAWSSLSTRIDSLPLVLAGPILRRTEKDNVTVWLALKSERTVTLEVYGTETTPILYLKGFRKTVKMGSNLHLVAVTAESVNGKILLADTTYTYRLFFTDEMNNTKKLDDAGVMHSLANQYNVYTYTPAYPSLSLPPSDINNLRIIHASCRKPHGGKVDAFIAIDNILKSELENSKIGQWPLKRPHQLFLTGDQIYADDVDGILLYMLDDASKALLGWNGKLPLGTGIIPEGFLSTSHIESHLPEILLPGKREKLVKDNGFTTGESHLTTLGEYLCMYLFVWSDVLWPTDWPNFPEYTAVYPGLKPPKTIGGFNLDLNNLFYFKQSLYKARKVLANVPSYMMCDDHEVADDWFLNLLVTQNVIGDYTGPSGAEVVVSRNQLTSRIMQNGLVAFALCQCWGNTPDYFDTGNGATIFPVLSDLVNAEILDAPSQANTSFTIWEELREIMLPKLALDGTIHKKLIGGLRYHFEIDFNYYRVIVLDTRNKRRFRKDLIRKTSSADLMSLDALNEQLPDYPQGLPANIEFTLLISPSPVLGHRFVEEKLQEGLIEGINSDLGYKLFYDTNYPKFELFIDKEGWAFGETIYQELLHRLASYKKVVILSGDVHYGFTGQIEYWDERTTNVLSNQPQPQRPRTAKYIQLTSSATKNTGDLQYYIALLASTSYSQDGTIFEFLNDSEYLGWNTEGYHIQKKIVGPELSETKLIKVLGYPKVHHFYKKTESVMTLAESPVQFRYRFKFGNDNRSEGSRGTNEMAAEDDSFTPTTESLMHSLINHAKRSFYSFQRRAVSFDNIGEVTFFKQTVLGVPSFLVSHAFRYNPAIKPWLKPELFGPYMVHTHSLELPQTTGSDVPGYAN